LIAGLEQPAAGEIRFDGCCVNGIEAAERDVGMVFQTPALFPHLTVRENLALGLVLRRAPREAIEGAVTRMARRLGLEGHLSRRPPELSGGEKQRVALGRALIRQPKILLLDEPLSNLDTPLRRQLRSDLRALHAESGTTTIYVTHDPGDVEAFEARIAVLQDGRLLQVGTVEELRAHPASDWVETVMESRK
jgi:ABC-type sugar transport system ATPase subunit